MSYRCDHGVKDVGGILDCEICEPKGERTPSGNSMKIAREIVTNWVRDAAEPNAEWMGSLRVNIAKALDAAKRVSWPTDLEVTDYSHKSCYEHAWKSCFRWLKSRLSAPSDEEAIGSSCYRGNTVRYIYDKLDNYSNQLGKAGDRIRELEAQIKSLTTDPNNSVTVKRSELELLKNALNEAMFSNSIERIVMNCVGVRNKLDAILKK